MDPTRHLSLSPDALYASLGTARSPLLVDVRPQPSFDADRVLIIAAIRRQPEAFSDWRFALPAGRRIVLYCADGAEISPPLAAALRASGLDGAFLEGGMNAWRDAALPLRLREPASAAWVTRERPKIDRIACPWLIRRFIDPEARLLYVPAAEVLGTAARTGATPYDIPGAVFGHSGDQCSFDTFLRIYAIRDAALDRLALIVRGADTGRPDLTPESPGLLAVSHGLAANFPDDHAMLEQGMHVYDALYAWCRNQIEGRRGA